MKRLWVAGAVIPLVAVGQWVAPAVSSAQSGSNAQAPLTASQARSLSTNVSKKVIVVFKDQVPQYPASRSFVRDRQAVISQDQHAVLGELSETKAQVTSTPTRPSTRCLPPFLLARNRAWPPTPPWPRWFPTR